MSDVQRWGNGSWPEWNVPEEDGMYVLFTDHERAVAEAVAAEREACAQVVEMQHIGAMDWDYNSSQSYGDIRHEAWQEAAAAIRARGET